MRMETPHWSSRFLHRWSNGIMPESSGPLLSCFAAPLAATTPKAWIDYIDATLASSHNPGSQPGLASSMARFRDACVFDPAWAASRAHSALLGPRLKQRVLLIDDNATERLNPSSRRARKVEFERMASVARDTHPGAEFWFAHSGASALSVRDTTTQAALRHAGRHINQQGTLCASLPYFDHVYTISAPEGMQALLCGIPLYVFGTPYYAGWGLTRDVAPQPLRHTQASLAALFETVFIRLSEHLDPVTGAIGSLDQLLSAIEAHRATTSRFADIDRIAGVSFQWWKRPFVTPYLTAGGGKLRWVRRLDGLQSNEYAAFWGSRSAAGLPTDIRTIRIEDGFLHSAGLGSDMVAPWSQILDRQGLYFDASRPSDLTSILNEAEFRDVELYRANALRREISRLGLTKYNLGRRRPTWRAPADRRIVLVPGQVADDASIRLGTRGIATSEELLREVRQRRPDAFIVYKPHPDVLSGNRQGLIEAQDLADVVERDADLISLIEASDEIHVLSSLSGFEALIRGKTVFTYGLPFYAGWGLTNDLLEQPWRKRALTLDMLTAGVLIRYPIYWDWTLKIFTTPEAVVSRLAPLADRSLEKIQGNRLRLPFKVMRWSRNAMLHLVWRCRRSASGSRG